MIREGSIEEVISILSQIPEFENPHRSTEFQRRLNSNRSLILVSEEGLKLQAFKCGYEREPGTGLFYSWMGGVVPEFRRQGIAKNLLHSMEDWCKKEQFEYLTFKTLNRHKTMLIFALRNDFDIIRIEKKGSPSDNRIWMMKRLT